MQEAIPKVSVLLPTFNGGPYLLRAVESICAQSFTDWELLVMDDGSTDGSTQALAALNDQRIRLMTDGTNKGLSARLNQGVAFCRGQYIARMDADDLCFAQRLEKQVRFLDEHLDIDLVSSRALTFDSLTGEPIGLLPYREDHAALTSRPWSSIYMPHPTWMGRAQWFRRFEYRHPEVKRAEDQELLLRALPHSRYHSIPDVLLAYRQGKFNLRKTLMARRHLLAAQCGLFLERRQTANLIRATLLTGIKILIDITAAIPGLQTLFFMRMRVEVPPDIQQQYEHLRTAPAEHHVN